MTKYLLKRLLNSIIAVVGITFVVFIVLHLSGDPVTLMVSPSTPTTELNTLRQEMGFNDPILVQYWHFVKNAAVGNFGQSYYYDEPAMSVVLERLPATLELSFAALIISIVIGFPAGIISAVKRNSKTDAIIRCFALLGQCIPAFWLGIMLVLLFSVKLGWLPTSGNETIQSLIMPAFTLGIFSAVTIVRLLRSNMIEVLNKEYIEVVKAKGLRKSKIILKHALKNAISSILTVLGLQIAALIGGSVIIETIFDWPGIGRLAIQSINNRDFMVVEAIVFVIAISFVLINFVVDMLYSIINPRIKIQ